MVTVDRLVLCFFALFLSVYFLESIGGFYMTSAIVSIEKQFQIPSKISGMMVSAGDFGYIPSVVFVAYLGSKGNRARWIGGGCTLIAIANMLISSSNFLFPGSEVKLNTSTVETLLERDIHRMPRNLTLARFLAELPEPGQRQRIALRLTQRRKMHLDARELSRVDWLDEFGDCLSPDAPSSGTDPICHILYEFLHRHNAPNASEVTNWRLLSATSYAFCDKSLNALRGMIDTKRCGQEMSNMGPTITIFLGLLILGVGRTMPFSLGLPLIDDNVRRTNLPLYFAGMFCIRIMGPMLGFLMGSFFNKLYYIVGEAPHGMTPRDPLWIGRWWAGFLAIGAVLLLPSLALFFFRNPKEHPRRTSTTDGESAEDEKQRPRGLALVDRHLEKGENGEAVVPKGVFAKGVDFTQTMSTVIRQPVYRWAMAGRIIDVFAFKGFHIFMPKYLELQFGIPQYEVNRLMGVIGVLAFAVGVLCGSLVMRGAKLQGRKAATWVAVTGAIAACFSILNSFVGCKSTMTALGDSLLGNNNFNLGGVNGCRAGCDCSSAPLYPVCDINGTVYYSPCHAGCQLSPSAFGILNTYKTPVFDACGCAYGQRVSREFCQDGNCRSMLYWYFTNMAIGGVVGGMGVVPGVLIMLRSVPPKHRSISLGFNGFLVSLLATLPSPIVWGTIIDHFCLFWTEKCGERGACALYATNGLQFWMHFVYGGLRIVSMITDLFVIYHAVGLKLTDSESPGDGEGSNNQQQKGNKSKQYKEGEEGKEPEQAEALLMDGGHRSAPVDDHQHRHVSCAPPDYDESLSNSQRRAAQPPQHRRSASRSSLSMGTEDLQAFRKISSHVGGPIAEC